MATKTAFIKETPIPEFQTDQVVTIAGGHFIHDIYTAFVAPLLPLIINKLSLSLTLAGSLTLFMQLPSLLNPFIGYLDDKINLRYLVIFAPAVTGTLISGMGIAPTYLSLALLLFFTGVSIAAFHAPAPAMIARISEHHIGKGMGYFMAGGELGRTVGPIVAVWAVSLWAFDSMFQLAILGWATSLVLFVRLRRIPTGIKKQSSILAILPQARRLFIPLFALVIARSFLTVSLAVYLPTLLSQEGARLIAAGGALSIFEFAGVIGALASGTISDRFGRKPVLFISFLSSAILLFILLQVQGLLFYAVLIPMGLATLSAQPVLLAIVQDQLPNHRAVANGFYLAVSFMIRSGATLAIGYLGDLYGLRSAFLWSGFIALIFIPVVFAVPDQEQSD